MELKSNNPTADPPLPIDDTAYQTVQQKNLEVAKYPQATSREAGQLRAAYPRVAHPQNIRSGNQKNKKSR